MNSGHIIEIFGVENEWKWLLYDINGETLLMSSTWLDSPTSRGRRSQMGRAVGRYRIVGDARGAARQWALRHLKEGNHVSMEMGAQGIGNQVLSGSVPSTEP
jgi:hypothetical protein